MSFPASKAQTIKPRKARGNRKLEPMKLQITSLIDIMTVLCMFMLQSFSSENQIQTDMKDLVLPYSSAKKSPELTVTLKINGRSIMAEDKVVASVSEALASDDLVIPGLYAWLGERRAATEKISQYSTKMKFKGDITIEADKRIRFRLLKKIMYTCGQQGYNNFSLAVQQKG
ncbi:MAG: biopolymer transporter ExbD [Chitinispirillaceae bacterium]|jgi:biopolymer transport protein ExbD|nr:biopolymer transporter ExbD [Chitinispirillaceae bacterium]